MQKIDFIYCMNEKSVNLLSKYGINNTGVCGDTRFDRVYQNSLRCIPMPLIAQFTKENKVLILGSSWPREEEIIAHYIQKHLPDDLKVIIAPHDISEEHLKEIESRFDRGLIRYSKATNENIQSHKILLIDNIGMLANCYQYGDIAFIGGGFTNDLHNILEAAAMGNALLYGNKVSKYPEGEAMQEAGGSFLIDHEDTFAEKLNLLLANQSTLLTMQKNSKTFVEQHQGASEKVFEKLEELID